jgi:hypothetical protein
VFFFEWWFFHFPSLAVWGVGWVGFFSCSNSLNTQTHRQTSKTTQENMSGISREFVRAAFAARPSAETVRATSALNSLRPIPGSRKTARRVGRGTGCSKGKTSGRGHKGSVGVDFCSFSVPLLSSCTLFGCCSSACSICFVLFLFVSCVAHHTLTRLHRARSLPCFRTYHTHRNDSNAVAM